MGTIRSVTTCGKYLWAGPTTALGLLLVPAALVSGGHVRIIAGVLEIYGGLVVPLLRHAPFVQGGALALTLGHVVLGQSPAALDISREHEHVHVRQCERWGPLFIPAYLLAGLWSWLRWRDPYRDNPFEREAHARSAH